MDEKITCWVVGKKKISGRCIKDVLLIFNRKHIDVFFCYLFHETLSSLNLYFFFHFFKSLHQEATKEFRQKHI